MMLDVVSVIEEQPIVDAAVVTDDGAIGMLKGAVELAETQPYQKSREIRREQETRIEPCDGKPEHEDGNDLQE